MDGRTLDHLNTPYDPSVELNRGNYFHMRYPYIEFQDPSFNGLKDTVTYKTVMYGRTDEPKHYAPPTFLA